LHETQLAQSLKIVVFARFFEGNPTYVEFENQPLVERDLGFFKVFKLSVVEKVGACIATILHLPLECDLGIKLLLTACHGMPPTTNMPSISLTMTLASLKQSCKVV
jgi:hypothetical protein